MLRIAIIATAAVLLTSQLFADPLDLSQAYVNGTGFDAQNVTGEFTAGASGSGFANGNGLQTAQSSAFSDAFFHEIKLSTNATNTTGGGFVPTGVAIAAATFSDTISAVNPTPPSAIQLHLTLNADLRVIVNSPGNPFGALSDSAEVFFDQNSMGDQFQPNPSSFFGPNNTNFGEGGGTSAGTYDFPLTALYTFNVPYQAAVDGYAFTAGLGALSIAWNDGTAITDVEHTLTLTGVTNVDGSPLDFPITFLSGGTLGSPTPEPSTVAMCCSAFALLGCVAVSRRLRRGSDAAPRAI